VRLAPPRRVETRDGERLKHTAWGRGQVLAVHAEAT
jgi:hypothetical protein